MDRIAIREYGNTGQAFIDKGMLENHGIPAIVEENSLSTLYPGAFSASVKLYVNAEDAPRATELLDSHSDR